MIHNNTCVPRNLIINIYFCVQIIHVLKLHFIYIFIQITIIFVIDLEVCIVNKIANIFGKSIILDIAVYLDILFSLRALMKLICKLVYYTYLLQVKISGVTLRGLSVK